MDESAYFILSSQYPEETLISPTSIPRVGNNPIRCSITGNSPAHHLYGVSSQVISGGVLINSGLVGQEVGIYIECYFYGTILKDFGLILGERGMNNRGNGIVY